MIPLDSGERLLSLYESFVVNALSKGKFDSVKVEIWGRTPVYGVFITDDSPKTLTLNARLILSALSLIVKRANP
jgi:hypothetical protein